MGAIQLSLLERGFATPRLDPSFASLQRTDLGEGAWIDYAPRWVNRDADLFDAVATSAAWNASRRYMYERFVDVPRLIAALPEDGGHPLIPTMAAILSARYNARFDALSVALYRDGRDSVAWHRDKGLREQPESTLAIVSLGDPRSFRLRPLGGGASIGFRCGWGDLIVMGGTIQRHWEHGVPKVAHAEPRIALMMRCTRETRWS